MNPNLVVCDDLSFHSRELHQFDGVTQIPIPCDENGTEIKLDTSEVHSHLAHDFDCV